MEQHLRRTVRRESSAERRAERERERYLVGERLVSRAERETPESLRAFLYEDPLVEPSQRDAGTTAEGRLISRRQHLLDRQRQQSRDSIDSANSTWNMSSDQPSRDLQRRFSREPPPRRTETLPSFASLTSAASLPPLRYLGNRRGWNNVSSSSGPSGHSARQRAERILDRNRTLAEQRPANPPSLEDLEPLDDANTHLRALLEYTNSTVMPSLSSSSYHTPQHDHTEDSRRVKRRKLDSERHGAGSQGFRYGRYGQVEPGQLRLEIETCDGGVYGNEEENPPESILKNDDSVYVGKCPIIAGHSISTRVARALARPSSTDLLANRKSIVHQAKSLQYSAAPSSIDCFYPCRDCAQSPWSAILLAVCIHPFESSHWLSS